MYVLTMSTPERASVFISDRTHSLITKDYGNTHNGYSLWYFNGKYRYVGFLCNGTLRKV